MTLRYAGVGYVLIVITVTFFRHFKDHMYDDGVSVWDELRFRDWMTEALASLNQPGPEDAEPPADGVEQVPAGVDAAGMDAAGEVVADGVAQVQAGAEPAGGMAGLSPLLGGPFRPSVAVLVAGGGVGVVAPLVRAPAPVRVTAPVRVVPAPPPQVEEEDPMDFGDGEDQEDPDSPKGPGLDALLDLVCRDAGMPSPLGFASTPLADVRAQPYYFFIPKRNAERTSPLIR